MIGARMGEVAIEVLGWPLGTRSVNFAPVEAGALVWISQEIVSG